MSLRRALEGLPGDRATEGLVRSILEIMRARQDPMSAGQVATTLGHAECEVSSILDRLTDGSVLRREGLLFSMNKDRVLDVEIDRFLHRAERHTAFVRSNVLKFRDRHGGP